MSDLETNRSDTAAQVLESSFLDPLITLAENWKLLVFGPLLVAILAFGFTYVIPPTYTARTTFLPPQQQQSAAVSALASLGALSGLAGVTGRTPADQYVALLRSATVSDRLIDEFKLMGVYDSKYRADARRELASNVRVDAGKKDGLITIDVEDESPLRAAALANRYVDELRTMVANLAITEAQQRRKFFESELSQTRARLTKAQIDLQTSGFSAGALRAEPKAAAEGYARLKAEITANEVHLQALRRWMTDTAPEVQQKLATLSALRIELARLETKDDSATSPGYISKFREFKYQESLFEVFSRQFELARLDESREGALIQVVDLAQAPERRTSPKRLATVLASATASGLLLVFFVFVRHAWRSAHDSPRSGERLKRLRQAFHTK